MKETLVNCNISSKLKEVGFDERCYGRYVNGELQFCPHSKIYEPNSETNASDMCNAPTILELLKWLREVHNIHIVITTDDGIDFGWCLNIINNPEESGYWSYYFETYEQALEAAILKSIKIIEDERI